MTTRKDVIFKMLCQNKTRREIGQAVGLSEDGVKYHVMLIYREHNIEGRGWHKRDQLIRKMQDAAL